MIAQRSAIEISDRNPLEDLPPEQELRYQMNPASAYATLTVKVDRLRRAEQDGAERPPARRDLKSEGG